MKRYKITGYLNAAYTTPEGNVVQPKKTIRARTRLGLKIATVYLTLFFDYVESEV